MQGKEKALQSQNKTRQVSKQDKLNNKFEQLKEYVKKSPYIDVLEQPIICRSFGYDYIKSIFQQEYRKRFYNYLMTNTTTIATVSKETNIPHKYLCEVKFHFEEKGLLQVVMMDRCPTTGSSNVQFVSTNPEVWNNPEQLSKSNQTKLF